MNIRNIALNGLFVGMLAACASPIQPDVDLPTATQPESTRSAIANPASQNCLEQGGTLSFEVRGDGGQFGVCYFEDNRQCEEWALMRGDCPAVWPQGHRVIHFRRPYCAITGGKLRGHQQQRRQR